MGGKCLRPPPGMLSLSHPLPEADFRVHGPVRGEAARPAGQSCPAGGRLRVCRSGLQACRAQAGLQTGMQVALFQEMPGAAACRCLVVCSMPAQRLQLKCATGCQAAVQAGMLRTSAA